MSGEEEANSPPEKQEAFAIGHEGAGSDCLGKTINYGWQGLIVGRLNNIVPRRGCGLA